MSENDNKVPYFQSYINLVPEESVVEALKNSMNEQIDFLGSIPLDKADYAYAEGKWTIKQLIQHIIDTERIFLYRAVTFVREENASVPGYDHDAYTDNLKLDHVEYPKLVGELMTVRLSTVTFFENLRTEHYLSKGNANGIELSAENIGKIIVGHSKHHIAVIKERYLTS
jgi:hypothetical protein